MVIPNQTINEISASARESRPSANNVNEMLVRSIIIITKESQGNNPVPAGLPARVLFFVMLSAIL
jgi:hypothetical protein